MNNEFNMQYLVLFQEALPFKNGNVHDSGHCDGNYFPRKIVLTRFFGTEKEREIEGT